MATSTWKPDPIEVGDTVEVQLPGKGHRIGRVVAIEHGVYEVTFGKGRPRFRTRAVSYHPTPAEVATRKAELRQDTRRAVVESDFVGFDGPGIRETRPVLDTRGGSRAI